MNNIVIHKVKIARNLEELIYILISLFVFVFCLFNLNITYKVYEFLLIVTYIYLFALTLRYKNFSIYQVFLVTYFIFLLSRPFLDILGLYKLCEFDMFRIFNLNNEVICTVLRTLIVFLVGTSYAWLMSDKKAAIYYYNESKETKQALNKILKVLFYIYFVIFLLKIAYMIRFVASNGYLSLFTGEISEVKLPIIFTGSGTITEVLYALVLFYNRDKKSFIHYSAFYLVIGAFRVFTGQRSTSLLMFLFVIYMYSTYYKEIKMISARVVGLVIAISIGIELIAQFRIGGDISITGILTGNILYLLFANMGVSINVISGTVLYRDVMTNRFPFLISYFIDFFTRTGGQSISRITDGNYLGDHLTYTLSSTAYLTGRGTGTSIVAEVYDFCNGNMLLILLLSMLITFIILKICNKSYKSVFRFVVSYFVAVDFIFSPRWSVFKSISSIIFALVIAAIINAFENRTRGMDYTIQLTNNDS